MNILAFIPTKEPTTTMQSTTKAGPQVISLQHHRRLEGEGEGMKNYERFFIEKLRCILFEIRSPELSPSTLHYRWSSSPQQKLIRPVRKRQPPPSP